MTAVEAPGIVDGRYVLISADTHGGGSHEQYREYLDPEYRDEFDAWRNRYKNPFRDLHGPSAGTQLGRRPALAGTRGRRHRRRDHLPQHRPAVLPDRHGDRTHRRNEDVPLRLAGIRAHNRWLADFCSLAPERRAGIAQILINDVDEAIKDVQFSKEHGLRGGVLLPGRPDDSDPAPLFDPVYDPLWAACQDLDVTITHHGGQGSPDYGKHAFSTVLWMAETQWYSHRALSHLIIGGVFERFPRLRFVLTEQGCSWIPPMMKMLDVFHSQMATGRTGEMNFSEDQLLPLKPSEYFAQLPRGRELPEPIGVASDEDGRTRPRHVGQRLPAPREHLSVHAKGSAEPFADWDPRDVSRVVAENAAAVYGFDLDVLRPYAARVGPTVDEIRQPLDTMPKDSGSPAFTRN